MSDTKNDEKLRILQERLAQIKQKQNTANSKEQQKEAVIEIVNPDFEAEKRKKNTLNLSWIIRSIVISSVVFGIFYGYTNFSSLVSNFSAEKNLVEKSTNKIEYKLNLKGNNIAIIRSFEEETSAKALVNNLKVKGFNSDYFFLPNKSNSSKEVYQVFIGPYENEDETSQWIQNIDRKVLIVNLSNGRIYREMKSNSLMAKEKAEQEKIENDNKEKEKLKLKEAVKAKQEKIAKEKAEQENLETENKKKELTKMQEEEKQKEKEDFKLQKQELENEKNQLQKDREQLEKEERDLLRNKIERNSKIVIKYTFDFKTTKNDEGVLIIKNNANYPVIKQNYAKIAYQGGIEKIIEKAKYDLNTHGENIDGVYFEKNGTIVSIYNGKITEVSL